MKSAWLTRRLSLRLCLVERAEVTCREGSALNNSKAEEEFSKDTRPLEPRELSDDELLVIYGIEERLRDAQKTPPDPKPLGRDLYLATTQKRHPRALLLDGGRGTGKTSLLLTLVKRWHRSDDECYKDLIKSYKDRVELLYKDLLLTHKHSHNRTSTSPEQIRDKLNNLPTHVSVVPILDFDPLPPGMPLIAGIMQAWRPLAEEYYRLLGDDYEGGSLMDSWHRLFRIAAVGWSSMSSNRGLIEQVLDREDQVQDWQRLNEQWQSFVNEVISPAQRRRLEGSEHELAEDPVFVIMIDDVDLQVERIRELLPALRMLYHPRVFFLVAAHQKHMLASKREKCVANRS